MGRRPTSEAWESHAGSRVRRARKPGHDYHYESLNLPRFSRCCLAREAGGHRQVIAALAAAPELAKWREQPLFLHVRAAVRSAQA